MGPKERDALTDWIGDQLTAKELLGLLSTDTFKVVAQQAVKLLDPDPDEDEVALKRALEVLGQ